MNRSALGFRQYYRAVLKRWWLVLITVALVVGVAYWRVGLRRPTYAASTLLMVTAPILPAPTSDVGGGQGSAQQLSTNINTVINDITNLIKTRPVTERVAKELGLKGPEVVQRSVSASRISNTDLVKIRATYSERSMAPRLADKTAEVLVGHIREVNRRDAREVRVFIEQQLTVARARVAESDRAIEAFKVRHGILVFDSELSQASSDAAKARSDREAAIRELRETEARVAAARARLSREAAMRVVAGTLRDNPVFQQMQTKLTDLELQRANLSQTFTDAHPKMVTVTGEIADVKAQIQSVAKKVLDNEVSQSNPVFDQMVQEISNREVDRAEILARIEALGFLQRRLAARNARQPALETGLHQLERENEVLADAYSTLSEQYHNALIRENQAGFIPAGLQVMEPAVAPSAATGFRLPLVLAVAALLGLLLGAMGALVLEMADDRIRTPGDAERALGAPVLAEVPDVTPARAAPAAAALLLVMIALLLGIVAGLVFSSGAPPLRNAPSAWASRIVHGVEAIPSWVAQAIR